MAKLFSRDVGLDQEFAFSKNGKSVKNVVIAGGQRYASVINARSNCSRRAHVAWVQAFLAGKQLSQPEPRKTIRAVDLFSAAGGMTCGMKAAAHALGMKLEVAMAVDSDLAALEIYRTNHGPWLSSGADVQSLVNFQIAGRGDDASWSTWPTLIEPHMASFLTDLDLVVAGPPCQGHSNLNNKTRRNDHRNLLYLTTAAFAVAVGSRVCVIENVPEVLNDSHQVVQSSRALLIRSGYKIDDAIVSADEFGVPQRRRRHFLVAVRNLPHEFDLAHMLENLKLGPVSVRQAIGDIAARKLGGIMDSVGTLSAENIRRIDWLHDNDKDELVNSERPDCHKDGHTYPSVYGRIKWDEPAQTLTTGFMTPGRGRFVHPSNRRTITPREAARLQGFPDSYEFSAPGRVPSRALLQKVIGDAVPPLLARAIGLCALSLLIAD